MTAPQSHDQVTGFCVEIDGETTLLQRDVCHRHPARVHEALGTKDESELQAVLDGVGYADYFDRQTGEYLGADENGLGLYAA